MSVYESEFRERDSFSRDEYYQSGNPCRLGRANTIQHVLFVVLSTVEGITKGGISNLVGRV